MCKVVFCKKKKIEVTVNQRWSYNSMKLLRFNSSGIMSVVSKEMYRLTNQPTNQLIEHFSDI